MLGKYRAVIAAARRSFSFASDVVVVVSLLVELLPLATTPFLLGPVALWSIQDKSDESVESRRSSSAVATPRATTNRTSGRRARNVALLFFPERFWDCVAIEALIKVLFVLVVFVLFTDDAIEKGDDDALVVVVEDKDPIVVIVFFSFCLSFARCYKE